MVDFDYKISLLILVFLFVHNILSEKNNFKNSTISTTFLNNSKTLRLSLSSQLDVIDNEPQIYDRPNSNTNFSIIPDDEEATDLSREFPRVWNRRLDSYYNYPKFIDIFSSFKKSLNLIFNFDTEFSNASRLNLKWLYISDSLEDVRFSVVITNRGANMSDKNELIYRKDDLSYECESNCFCKMQIDFNFTVPPYSLYIINLIPCDSEDFCSFSSESKCRSPTRKPGQMTKPNVRKINESKYRVLLEKPSEPNGPITRYHVMETYSTDHTRSLTFLGSLESADIDVNCANYSNKLTSFNISVSAINNFYYHQNDYSKDLIGEYSSPTLIEMCDLKRFETQSTNLVISIVVIILFSISLSLMALYFTVKRYRNVKSKKENLVIKVQCNESEQQMSQLQSIGHNSMGLNDMEDINSFSTTTNYFASRDIQVNHQTVNNLSTLDEISFEPKQILDEATNSTGFNKSKSNPLYVSFNNFF